MDMSFQQELYFQFIPIAVVLIFISIIDIKYFIIPDYLNFALLVIGLLKQGCRSLDQAIWAFLFGMLMFSMLWFLRLIFFRIREKHGLGLGDVKMAAAAAVIIEPWHQSLFFLLAAASAMAYFGVSQFFVKQKAEERRIPFGPFLSLSLFIIYNLESMNIFF